MAMEVSCGQCSGRLLIETPGVIVACPHCGVHLSIPVPEAAPPVADSPAVTINELNNEQGNSSNPSPIQIEVPTPPKSQAETIVIPRSPKILPESSLGTESKSSIFHTVEDKTTEPGQNGSSGWPSTPNLSLTDAKAQHNPVVTEPKPEPTPASSDISPRIDSHTALGNESAPSAVIQPFSFGAAASAINPPANQASQNEIGNSSSPNPLTQNVSAQAIESTPPTGKLAAPDFSWMTETKSAPSANPPLQFSFGQSPDINVPSDSGAQTANIGHVADSNSREQTIESTPTGPVIAVQNQLTEAQGFAHRSQALNRANDEDVVHGLQISNGNNVPSFSNRSPVSTKTAVTSDESGSRPALLMTLLLIVGTYASLATIYLIYLIVFGREHQLESLPDLKTVQQQGGRAVVPKPENRLPPGHELKLGQTERYGDIRVTPLRVTRGPVAFAHYTGDKSHDRQPSEPVLKLWLKFENVSPDKTITPLDTTLMFFRRYLNDRMASYNVLFCDSDRSQKDAQFHYTFDRLAADSEWIIVGQHTNEALAPRQSFETFIPSEENVDGLDGKLVWRVHIRKGYGPKSGNGVTTLIDVFFNSSDIKPDDA